MGKMKKQVRVSPLLSSTHPEEFSLDFHFAHDYL